MSVQRDVAVWEFEQQKEGIYHHNEGVLDQIGLLFCPEHNVLLVAGGSRERLLIVDPGTEVLVQTIDLPEIGIIDALGLYKKKLVILYNYDGWKISYYDLL